MFRLPPRSSAAPAPGAGSPSSELHHGLPRGAAPAVAQPVRLPSRRVSALLAGAMLGAGIAIGAAIGPSPERSFGSDTVPGLVPYLATLLRPPAAGAAPAPAAASVTANPVAPPTPEPPASVPSATASQSAEAVGGPSQATPASASAGQAPAPGAGKPSTGANATKGAPGNSGTSAPGNALPKVGHVWLIVLSSGEGFAGALRSPASAKFINEALIGQGALLRSYSAAAASELASAAAQLSQNQESGLSIVQEPPCSAPSSPCAPGEPAGLTRADGFLAEMVPAITASPAYGQNGVIVITFGSVAQGLPSQSAAPSAPASPAAGPHASSEAPLAGLPSHPAAGAIVLSALVQSGARLKQSFQPLDPRKSLEQVFGV